MADDGGESLDIHAVLQGGSGEGMAQVMEADVLTIGPFQNRGQSLPHCRWVHGRILFDWGWEHPPRVAGLMSPRFWTEPCGGIWNAAWGHYLWTGTAWGWCERHRDAIIKKGRVWSRSARRWASHFLQQPEPLHTPRISSLSMTCKTRKRMETSWSGSRQAGCLGHQKKPCSAR